MKLQKKDLCRHAQVFFYCRPACPKQVRHICRDNLYALDPEIVNQTEAEITAVSQHKSQMIPTENTVTQYTSGQGGFF